MKLKELLACEYSERVPSDLLVGQIDPTIPSFIAGFEKAKELVLVVKLFKEDNSPHWVEVPRTWLETLGEEEVKNGTNLL